MPRSPADLLRAARDPSSIAGSRISMRELQDAWAAAKEPAPSDPAGKPITPEEAALFEGLDPADLTWFARRVLGDIHNELPGLLQTGGGGGAGQVRPVPEKRGHAVFLTPNAGFAVDQAGQAPADLKSLTGALYDAGRWLQASFGTNENLFKTAGLDVNGKKAVLAQFQAALRADGSSLSGPQKEQLLGSIAALATELAKSIEFVPMSPASNAELLQLRDEAFSTLKAALDDPRMSVLVKRSIVGYLGRSDSFQAKLTPAQKGEIQALHDELFPKAPADYAKWEAQGKSKIVIDHASGAGENFLFGFMKQLREQGLDRGSRDPVKFQVVSGDGRMGPAVLQAVVPASHPLNKWGRDMTLEVRARDMSRDMYKGMGDPSVDVVHYGGHANFGLNTLQSLKNAPPQQGDKIIARDLCCGADTKNAEAHVYPEGALNSVTSVSSSYFRTTEDPQVGKYAYESEGYEMLMSITRGLLGKKDWDQIGADLERRANWWGHDSKNNWTYPTDPRAGSYLDDDDDGIPNVFDVLPSYDTTDVAGSVQKEFELEDPGLKPDQISGARAFQAVQFVNTATNYNPVLQPHNKQRRVHLDPNGAFFDAKSDPNTYVKFRQGQNGEHLIQLSSALADMTLESLRPVLYFEFVRHLAAQNPRMFSSTADRNAMGLLFAASSLEYDDGWRDREVFEGLKRMYGIPASVSLSDVKSALSKADSDRHNYTGDHQAVRDIVAAHKAALEAPGAGEPAIPVR